MALTDIGEIGVWVDGSEMILRPSLRAMSGLGSPSELVRIYNSVLDEHTPAFDDALAVVYACGQHIETEAIEMLFGYFTSEQPRPVYKGGQVPAEHIIFFAQVLVCHGLVGDLPPLRLKGGESPEYTDKFEAREMVAMATAHLGLSSSEAWDMTMTELVGALRAKYPDSDRDDKGAPTLSELEETLANYARIKSLRENNPVRV